MGPEGTTPPWLPALAPLIERDDLRISLKTSIATPVGHTIYEVPGVFMRFKRWTGNPFVDDFGKKAAGMIDLDGEHLFAELAVLRLLEKEGWSGRWVNTHGAKGEVWKYLTDWKDVPRDQQKNRHLEEAEPRQMLARIAGLNKPARYAGCWDTFAWRDSDFVFLETKRTTPKNKDVVRAEQEDWLRSALYVGDPRVTINSFCFVQWDYE